MNAIDILMTCAVLALLTLLTAFVASRTRVEIRSLIWLGFLEYMVCAAGQLLYSRVISENVGDAYGYALVGADMAKLLDTSWSWASHELFNLLIQRPSVFDEDVAGRTNTGSMYAAGAWLAFFLRGSTTAIQVLIAGFSFLGALGTFSALSDAYPRAPIRRMYYATVMFPSMAFWTAALHKEAFCLIATGLILVGWRSLYKMRFVRAAFTIALGGYIMLLFRAPAVPPLLLGLVLHYILERSQKSRSKNKAGRGPLYVAIGVALVAVGMLLVGKVNQDFAVDHISDSLAVKQTGWGRLKGGSSFETDEPIARTPLEQLARAPLALVNALFRPQLFDVRSPLVLVSALEMTYITYLVYKMFRANGFKGVMRRIYASPFLVMCTSVTVVGCTFVGLATLNFGSLSRYRVPFLPFYGALLASLMAVPAVLKAKTKASATVAAPRVPLRRRAPVTPKAML